MPNKYSVTSLCNDGAEILLISLEATFILFSNKNFVWNHTLLDSLKSIENL